MPHWPDPPWWGDLFAKGSIFALLAFAAILALWLLFKVIAALAGWPYPG